MDASRAKENGCEQEKWRGITPLQCLVNIIRGQHVGPKYSALCSKGEEDQLGKSEGGLDSLWGPVQLMWQQSGSWRPMVSLELSNAALHSGSGGFV